MQDAPILVPFPITFVAATLTQKIDRQTFHGIGRKGGMPWNGLLKQDMTIFRQITTVRDNDGRPPIVIMGRRTWDSIPRQHRPLKGRLNVVVSSTPFPDSDPLPCKVYTTLLDALRDIATMKDHGHLFVLGGQTIYKHIYDMHQERKLRSTHDIGLIVNQIMLPAIKDNVYEDESLNVAGTVPFRVDKHCDTFFPNEIIFELPLINAHSSANQYVCQAHFKVEKDPNVVCEDPGCEKGGRLDDEEDLVLSIVEASKEGFNAESESCVRDGTLYLNTEIVQLSSPVVSYAHVEFSDHTQGKGIKTIQTFDVFWNHESGYLDLAKHFFCPSLENKDRVQVFQKWIENRDDRTQVGTRSCFGEMLTFDLTNNTLPLFTTKQMNYGHIVKELIWFLQGKTDAKALSSQGVRIWDANGSREALDQRGLEHRREGDLGPIYGFQWRHFGAAYDGCDKDYSEKGVDQIKYCIDLIKNDPQSRRIYMTAWNPSALSEMALPPCHVSCQFYVHNNKLLDCVMYQRSGDMGLGVPYNVASYATLTILLAHYCGLDPGTLKIIIGDCHVYKNHLKALQRQCTRIPCNPPKLLIRKLYQEGEDISNISPEDFDLCGYVSHGPIQMKMAL